MRKPAHEVLLNNLKEHVEAINKALCALTEGSISFLEAAKAVSPHENEITKIADLLEEITIPQNRLIGATSKMADICTIVDSMGDLAPTITKGVIIKIMTDLKNYPS